MTKCIINLYFRNFTQLKNDDIPNLKAKDFIMICKKDKRMQMIKKFQVYLYKKLSVEYILEKLLEIEKMQYLTLNEDELKYFKLLKNPQIFSEQETALENLYKRFEFYNKKDQELSLGKLDASSPNFRILQQLLEY
jgi:hypothetical protein